MTLAAAPWFGVLLTLAVWEGASVLHRKWRTPLLNPVLISVVMLIGLLLLLRVPYADYEVGGRWWSFLLGPSVVALAVPLVRQLERVRANLPGIFLAVLGGCLAGIASAVGLARLLGGSHELALAMAPKSVTTPIALGIAEQLGGLPPLTAAIVILTGIFGAMLGPELIRLVRLRSRLAIGLGVGTAAHGIGTARVLHDDAVSGACSGIAMTLNGLLTALLLPWLLPWLLRFG
jgi:predicted murein hydrolase (TIGR00659 family)